jgi:hypothetical protein
MKNTISLDMMSSLTALQNFSEHATAKFRVGKKASWLTLPLHIMEATGYS